MLDINIIIPCVRPRAPPLIIGGFRVQRCRKRSLDTGAIIVFNGADVTCCENINGSLDDNMVTVLSYIYTETGKESSHVITRGVHCYYLYMRRVGGKGVFLLTDI